MGTQTATLRLTKPTINADGNGAWPADLNLNCDLTDRAINQVVTVSIPDTNVSLEADGTNGDQAVYLVYNFTGALTADRTVTLPANAKVGYAINATTGGHNVILSAGGTTLSVANAGWNFFYCDGTNVTTPQLGIWKVLGALTMGSGSAQVTGGTNNGVALTGSNTNDSASAGQVGEFISAEVASGSAVAVGNNTAGNIASISLTAGDWDVWGNIGVTFSGGAGTGATGWISTTSAAVPTDFSNGGAFASISGTTMSAAVFPTGTRRLSLASTTTVYLSILAVFTSSATGYGFIGARRRR